VLQVGTVSNLGARASQADSRITFGCPSARLKKGSSVALRKAVVSFCQYASPEEFFLESCGG